MAGVFVRLWPIGAGIGRILVLGDAHADEQPTRRALMAAYEESGADQALQVGDLLHYQLPAPTWFVAGNNEDLDVIASLRRGEESARVTNARLLASSAVELQGLRIGGLSGNHAPTQYETPRAALEGGRRRHFVKRDVERAKALSEIDVFLTHEAPHGLIQRDGYDVGCAHVDAILRALGPDLCLVGHHHTHVSGSFGQTKVVALAPVWESYYRLDPTSLELARHPAP